MPLPLTRPPLQLDSFYLKFQAFSLPTSSFKPTHKQDFNQFNPHLLFGFNDPTVTTGIYRLWLKGILWDHANFTTLLTHSF